MPVSFFFDGFSSDQAASPGCVDNLLPFDVSDTISRRDARLLRLWRAAPQPIGDEILALLSTLSPQIIDVQPGEPPASLAPPRPAAKPAAREPLEPPIRRPRRRHGAVWDPADIFNASRPARK